MRKLTMLTAAAALVLGFAGTAEATGLHAGKDDVGTHGAVTVSNTISDLIVTYSLNEPGWEFLETHLAVDPDDETCANVPQTKKGHPKTGHFPYATSHDPGDNVTQVTHEISLLLDLGDPMLGDVLCIAAHALVAVVEEIEGVPTVIDEQSAWGDGDQFADDRNWAMYFTYTMQ